MKRVVVVLRGAPGSRPAEEGLRTAVGYLTAGLRVTVVLCGAARGLTSDEAPALARRALDTLRALGQRVVSEEESDVAALLREADHVVTW